MYVGCCRNPRSGSEPWTRTRNPTAYEAAHLPLIVARKRLRSAIRSHLELVVDLGLEPSLPITDAGFTDPLVHPHPSTILWYTERKSNPYPKGESRCVLSH
jgi:hypothetical protein